MFIEKLDIAKGRIRICSQQAKILVGRRDKTPPALSLSPRTRDLVASQNGFSTNTQHGSFLYHGKKCCKEPTGIVWLMPAGKASHELPWPWPRRAIVSNYFANKFEVCRTSFPPHWYNYWYQLYLKATSPRIIWYVHIVCCPLWTATSQHFPSQLFI